METKLDIRMIYELIIDLLDKKELKNAFGMIQVFLNYKPDSVLQNELDTLEDTYRQMLSYTFQGIKDPMRESIYNDILLALYELTDRIKTCLLSEHEAASNYHSTRKSSIEDISIKTLHEKTLHSYKNIFYRRRYEENLALLFNKIWLTPVFTEEDADEALHILNNKEFNYTVGCQMVSAMALSLLTVFDIKKIFFLIHASDEGHHEEIRTRALIWLMLILYIHKSRIHLYQGIADRIAVLAEQPDFIKKLRTVTMKFILAKETEKISRKLNEEIMPAMIKHIPNINKITLSDFDPEMLSEGNPEWDKIINDSALGKSIEEYNELQMEGADVMHSTFTYLKHFDFFREISNWFLPFTTDNSYFESIEDDESRKGITGITDALIFLCNSDKYSFLFTIMRQMPAERSLFMGKTKYDLMDIMDNFKDILTGQKGKFDIIAGQYIQDLYRFFKLHPMHKDYLDIFTLRLDFYNIPALRPYFSDKETLSLIAEYFLKKKYFDEALDLFSRLQNEEEAANDMLMQKIGYCHQMKGDIEAALSSYLQADLLNTDSKWLMKRIAGCYRATGRSDKALDYYRRLEAASPDNLSVQLSIGHCYLETGKYAEALKYYFKVDYLEDADGNKAQRPLAWCLFLSGKYEQASEYYKKILERNSKSDSAAHDFINAGHAAWAGNKVAEAVKYYSLAIKTKEDDDDSPKVDFATFASYLEKDSHYLVAAGISPGEIPLLLDKLRYMLSK